MRAHFLIAAALALSACGSDEPSANDAAPKTGETADRIVANDVTAIDAVTADAANMAADINYLEAENLSGNASGNEASPGTRRRPATTARSRASEPQNNDSAAAEPASNSAE